MEAKRCTRWARRSPYGIGWRTTTTRFPASRRVCATRRVVWLFPEPVRTAQTATVGTSALSVVSFGPSSVKLAPAARTSLALCITYSWETSE